MGDFRAKVVALATLSTVAILAACAPAAEGGPATTAPQSAEASASPSVTPSLEASQSPPPTLSPEPTLRPEPRVTDEPTADGDGDGGDGGGDDQPSVASTWTYRWATTDGYPTYYPEAGPPDNPDGTLGSGCDPPDPETLPDGIWRGVIAAYSTDAPDLWIWFDLVCAYSPQFADAPESQIGAWSFHYPDMNYIVTNDNPQGRKLPVAEEVVGYGWINRWQSDVWHETFAMCGDNGCDVWIWINDGEVTEVSSALFDTGDGLFEAPAT